MKMKFGIKEVVATGIGTALFVALTEVQIPLGFIPNTALQPRAALLAFLAAVFGPVVGGIVGLLGHAIGDALFYGSVWWSWVFPDAVFGILVGLFAAKYAIKDGGFEKKQIVLFNVVQVVANLAAWVIVAPVLDIVIYAEPANKVFAQGGMGMPWKRDYYWYSWYFDRSRILQDRSKIVQSLQGGLGGFRQQQKDRSRQSARRRGAKCDRFRALFLPFGIIIKYNSREVPQERKTRISEWNRS